MSRCRRLEGETARIAGCGKFIDPEVEWHDAVAPDEVARRRTVDDLIVRDPIAEEIEITGDRIAGGRRRYRVEDDVY